MKDLTGKTFGELQVVQLHEVRRYKSARNTQTKAYYLVRCTCDTEKVVRGEHLSQGKTISCGCVARQKAGNRMRTHGMTGSPEYKSYTCMKQRIFSPDRHHKLYYAGIKIAERWLGKDGFNNFLEDMGYKPTVKHEIDRINPFGDYEPSNCRWATRKEQMNNLRKQYVS